MYTLFKYGLSKQIGPLRLYVGFGPSLYVSLAKYDRDNYGYRLKSRRFYVGAGRIYREIDARPTKLLTYGTHPGCGSESYYDDYYFAGVRIPFTNYGIDIGYNTDGFKRGSSGDRTS
jgi:hypothetical protein